MKYNLKREIALQKIFDKICIHLAEQKVASYSEETCTCLYRDGSGRKCAAGCLIPDSLYRKGMEEATVSVIPFFQERYPDSPLKLIRECQILHDAYMPRESYTKARVEVEKKTFKEALQRIAKAFGVNIPKQMTEWLNEQ